MLGDVSGTRVLDLFAGSGALGIEALSRGAAEAVFVDRSRKALEVVRRNLTELGLEGDVYCRDALSYLRGAVGGPPFDLVLVDPPYDSALRLGGALAELLPAVLAEKAVIVTESDNRNPLHLPFAVVRERTYGDTRIAIHGGREMSQP
jgi:16S rRNA (guanine966-N2)-methyltransferase